MTKVTYEIVEHDGGWAYKVGDVFSETFALRDDALEAAQIASDEQRVGGDSEGIEYQDPSGEWHKEVVDGGDRPETEVIDTA